MFQHIILIGRPITFLNSHFEVIKWECGGHYIENLASWQIFLYKKCEKWVFDCQILKRKEKNCVKNLPNSRVGSSI
jgi:hypothetical protein